LLAPHAQLQLSRPRLLFFGGPLPPSRSSLAGCAPAAGSPSPSPRGRSNTWRERHGRKV
jgi:hypothetical protein